MRGHRLIRKSSVGGRHGLSWGSGRVSLVGRLGGGFEVDLVAECFELADVFAFFAVGLDAAVVEAWAEVGELGAGT